MTKSEMRIELAKVLNERDAAAKAVAEGKAQLNALEKKARELKSAINAADKAPESKK